MIRKGGGPKIASYQLPATFQTQFKASKTYIEHGELCQNGAQFFIECILRKLDLAHVEVSYPADFEVFVDNLANPTFSTSRIHRRGPQMQKQRICAKASRNASRPFEAADAQ